MAAPKDPTWTGQESSDVHPRGKALVDIEFLMLKPVGDCVVTAPVRHLGLLAFLFPKTLFHVYNCLSHEAGQNRNVNRITAPLTDDSMNHWLNSGGNFSVVFTDESDARQLAMFTKMTPTATLFHWRSLPADHLKGEIFLPIYSPTNSTALFLHHSFPTDKQAVMYNSRRLGEEVFYWHQIRNDDYNQMAEDAILTFAVSEKIKTEGGQVDPVVVGAVVELLKGILPDVVDQ